MKSGVVVWLVSLGLSAGAAEPEAAAAKPDAEKKELKSSGAAGSLPRWNRYPRMHNASRELRRQLNRTVIEEAHFDEIPLPEVLRFVGEAVRRSSPGDKPVNFVLIQTRIVTTHSAAATLDPAEALIRIDPPLQKVTAAQLLDAVAKSSDLPLSLNLTDYAVTVRVRTPDEQHLHRMRQRVNPNAFQQGLQNVVGVPFGSN